MTHNKVIRKCVIDLELFNNIEVRKETGGTTYRKNEGTLLTS